MFFEFMIVSFMNKKLKIGKTKIFSLIIWIGWAKIMNEKFVTFSFQVFHQSKLLFLGI